MLGLLGLGTDKRSFTAPFFGLFRIAISEPVRFTYRALYLKLAKILLRPTTLLFITLFSFIVFDLDFEVVWEDEGEEDDDNHDHQWQDPTDFHRLGI
ncbi:hypothetical protein BX616_004349 [Lobosporangium transversale]|nr:hypothetical protein BX616_004349 [Lobosporangium transversale]